MTKYVAFFLHPTYRSLQHFSQLFFPNWNWTHLLSLAEWEQSENIWLSSPSLLRWENILNHFPQNLYQTIWRREKFYHFDKQAFWISKLKNYFSSRNKNGNGNGVSRFRRMDKSDHWEKLLSHAMRPPCILLMYWQLFIKKQSFYLGLGCFLIDMIDCGI